MAAMAREGGGGSSVLKAGPFRTFDEADTACLLLHARSTIVGAAEAWSKGKRNGAIPAWYIPVQRAFEIRRGVAEGWAEVPHLYRQLEAEQERARKAGKQPLLPAKVYTYSRTDLLCLCRALTIKEPIGSARLTRAGVIEYIEQELEKMRRHAHAIQKT